MVSALPLQRGTHRNRAGGHGQPSGFDRQERQGSGGASRGSCPWHHHARGSRWCATTRLAVRIRLWTQIANQTRPNHNWPTWKGSAPSRIRWFRNGDRRVGLEPETDCRTRGAVAGDDECAVYARNADVIPQRRAGTPGTALGKQDATAVAGLSSVYPSLMAASRPTRLVRETPSTGFLIWCLIAWLRRTKEAIHNMAW